MMVTNKLQAATALIGLAFATMASADTTADMQRMMDGINDECHDYARVLVDAEWASIQRGGRADGFSSDFKESLFRVEKAQCILTQQVLVFEMLQEETSQDEWISLGGQESLQVLREKLISTFPH